MLEVLFTIESESASGRVCLNSTGTECCMEYKRTEPKGAAPRVSTFIFHYSVRYNASYLSVSYISCELVEHGISLVKKNGPRGSPIYIYMSRLFYKRAL